MGPWGEERGEALDGTRYPAWVGWAVLAFGVGCCVYNQWPTWRRWWTHQPQVRRRGSPLGLGAFGLLRRLKRA